MVFGKARDMRSTLTIRVPSGTRAMAARGSRTLTVQTPLRNSRAPQLPDDPVERRSHTLCPADLVLLPGCVPIEFEGPAFRAVRQQAAQRQSDLDDIDTSVRAARHTAPQDMHRQRYDNALMTDELCHQ